MLNDTRILRALQIGVLLAMVATFVWAYLGGNPPSEQILFVKDEGYVIVKSLDTKIYSVEDLPTAVIITFSKGGVVRQIPDDR